MFGLKVTCLFCLSGFSEGRFKIARNRSKVYAYGDSSMSVCGSPFAVFVFSVGCDSSLCVFSCLVGFAMCGTQRLSACCENPYCSWGIVCRSVRAVLGIYFYCIGQ